MTSYTIETKQYTDISEVSAIRVGLSNLELFVKAEFDVRLYKTDGSFYKRFNFVLEGDNYNNWGNSDDYVINKICKLGYTLDINATNQFRKNCELSWLELTISVLRKNK